ncbi:MAG: hypothetical protein QNK23_11950 [Crocinitomicaceae bacterium]|nr:hypothetical protein [Crocinitomicaceae bacterium]
MNILEIKEQLATFKVVQCDLFHETVKLDPQTGTPIEKQSSDGMYLERVQLCDMGLRKERLGCAHSSSNNRFNNLISDIQSNDPKVNQLQEDINGVILKIYKLDHEKGDLEKEYALSKKAQDGQKVLTEEVQVNIDACNEKHRGYLKELQELKNSLIDRLDEILLTKSE